jgi:hypothetical protein
VRAGLDSATINSSIDAFTSAALSKGLSLQLINLPQAHHGFDLVDDTDWARRAIQETLTFAREATSEAAKQAPSLPSLKVELVRLEEERQVAYVRGDRTTLERQFATEYVHTNLRGGTTDREQELEFYARGSFTLANARISDVDVRSYGSTAVLRAIVEWNGASYHPPGQQAIDLSGRFRVTRVYVFRDDRWQLASSHASRIGG